MIDAMAKLFLLLCVWATVDLIARGILMPSLNFWRQVEKDPDHWWERWDEEGDSFENDDPLS